MLRIAHTAGRVGQLVRVRPAVGHQLLHIADRQLGVLFRLILHLALEDQRVDGGFARRPKQHRRPIRRRPHHRLRAQHAAGAGLVFHHHALRHFAAQAFGQQAAHAVHPAAGGKRHDQADRPADGGGLDGRERR
ncbi:hypothetical protein G6F22_020085 [Rhizopus arrhizus]|nr:hypothetical protein G6F22_020085 [Rhizopus arrhizus]